MCKPEKALECFNNGFNCAQAVFSTYSEELGLDAETSLKVAGAFGGGMGHIDETCGAVTGAIMLIGLKYGKYKADDNAAREKSYSLAQVFAEKFKSIHGSLRCSELLGYDLSKDDELKAAREKGLFKSICPVLVKDASEIVESIL